MFFNFWYPMVFRKYLFFYIFTIEIIFSNYDTLRNNR